MSGLTEILLIVAVIVVLFMLPRLMNRKPEKIPQGSARRVSLTGRMRIAVLASSAWPVLIAFFLQPWNGRWFAFFYLALAPVFLMWGIYWAWSGFRKNRK